MRFAGCGTRMGVADRLGRRRYWLLFAVVALAGLVVRAQDDSPAQQGTYVIAGLVTDERGAPFAGAEVMANLWMREYGTLLPPEEAIVLRTETDAQGWYRFEGVETGVYAVVVRVAEDAMGFMETPGAAMVNEGMPQGRVDIRLNRESPTRGVVQDTAGNPVAGALVVAFEPRRDYGAAWIQERLAKLLPVTTDAAGCFTHRYTQGWVEVRAQGYAPAVFQVNTGRDDNVLTLSTGAAARGVVSHATGDPAAGATVIARREVGAESTATCDANGAYVFENLVPGTEYRLEANLSGAATCETLSLELADGEQREGVDLSLCEGATIVGRVYGSDTKRPFEGTNVRAEASGFGNTSFEAVTDADGSYSLGPLPPGEYSVTCSWPASSQTEVGGDGMSRLHAKGQTCVVRSGETASIDFTFEQGTFVAGRITDDGDRPVAGARITAGNRPGYVEGGERSGSGKAVSETDGCYTVWGLLPDAPGGIEVRAEGYAPLRVNFEAPKTGLASFDIVLEAGSSVSGVVKDRHGAAQPYSELEAKPVPADAPPGEGRGSIEPVKTLTDAEGRFAFQDLPTATYLFSLYTHNPKRTLTRTAQNPPLAVEAGQTIKDVEIVVPGTEDGAFRGVVKDTEGEPLRNVRVQIPSSHYYQPLASTTTDDSGAYLLGGMGEEARDFVFELEGYATARLKGIATDTNLDVVLDTLGSIRGKVLEAVTQEPLKKFEAHVERVRARYGEEGGHGEAVDLGPRARVGEFAIDKVVPGRVTLKVSAPGYVEQEAPAVVLPSGGAVEDVKILLEPAAILEGTITREGKPLTGFEQWMTVYTTDDPPQQVAGGGYNVSDGKYRFDTLREGEYRVEANVRGPGGEWHPSQTVKAEAGTTTTVNFEIP